MTAAYKLVQWNRHKKVYDLVLVGACVAYLAGFFIVSMILYPAPNDISPPIIAMRALGTLAIILLHIILCIGPIARLTPRMAPLLYNRRHLGVTFFLIALLHAVVAIGFYGAFGMRNPISALFDTGTFSSISGFPFESLGFFALLIFFVMAATSHDFWLANLSPRVWKSIHMSVYLAYGLVIGHVALGALQAEIDWRYAALLGAGVLLVTTLHIVAGVRELLRDRNTLLPADSWVDVAGLDDIDNNGAKVVCLKGRERIAIFKYDNKVSAVSNVCAHQGGPLGEGRIVDGCITCPWHGYQYKPESGTSPPPYTEKIPTYEVRVEGSRILVNPEAKPPGTAVSPAEVGRTH